MINSAQIAGKILGINFLTKTHNELLLQLKTLNGPVNVIISDIQTIEAAKDFRLGDEITVTGRLGGGSTVHAVEVT